MASILWKRLCRLIWLIHPTTCWKRLHFFHVVCRDRGSCKISLELLFFQLSKSSLLHTAGLEMSFFFMLKGFLINQCSFYPKYGRLSLPETKELATKADRVFQQVPEESLNWSKTIFRNKFKVIRRIWKNRTMFLAVGSVSVHLQQSAPHRRYRLGVHKTNCVLPSPLTLQCTGRLNIFNLISMPTSFQLLCFSLLVTPPPPKINICGL